MSAAHGENANAMTAHAQEIVGGRTARKLRFQGRNAAVFRLEVHLRRLVRVAVNHQSRG